MSWPCFRGILALAEVAAGVGAEFGACTGWDIACLGDIAFGHYRLAALQETA